MFNDFSVGWAIGGRGGVAGQEREWNGFIDDVRIYNHPLTPAEIAQVIMPGPPLVPGDTDGDMLVELEDFNPIRDNFRKTVAARAMGDLVRDGKVDFLDFRQWKTAFTAGGGSLLGLDVSFASVPEPTSMLSATMGLLAMTSLRRKSPIGL
jgi:hypothetical protein